MYLTRSIPKKLPKLSIKLALWAYSMFEKKIHFYKEKAVNFSTTKEYYS